MNIDKAAGVGGGASVLEGATSPGTSRDAAATTTSKRTTRPRGDANGDQVAAKTAKGTRRVRADVQIGGGKVDPARSPAFGAAAVDPFVTYYVFSTRADQDKRKRDYDLNSALKAFLEANAKDAPELIDRSGQYEGKFIKLRASLVKTLAGVVKKSESAAMVKLEDLLGSRAEANQANALEGLYSPAMTTRTAALLAVCQGSQELGTLPSKERDLMAGGLHETLLALSRIYIGLEVDSVKDRITEIQRPRSEEKSFGDVFAFYADAEDRAVRELWERGGTPELVALRGLMTKAVDLLSRLDTPLSCAYLAQALDNGCGAVLAHVAAKPQIAHQLGRAYTTRVQAGIARTTQILTGADPATHLLDRKQGPSQKLYPLQYVSTKVCHWTDEYPFWDVPPNLGQLFGTAVAATARSACRDAILASDAMMPVMGAAFRAAAGSVLTMTEDLVLTTSQLAGLNEPSEAYSPSRAFCEQGALLAELMEKVSWPGTRQRLSECALYLLERWDRMPEHHEAVGAKAARERLVAALRSEKLEPQLHAAVSRALRGEQQEPRMYISMSQSGI